MRTPIVVLSNNDGCVISRSPEAKALGIRMGEPWFKIRKAYAAAGGVAFSSNYALYGDISERVMTVIEGLVPKLEVYSIDEAFAELTGIQSDLVRLGREIRSQVLASTGIPTGVGIASTKTLAKLANYAAKRWQKQTGGVVDLTDSQRRDKLLRAVAVNEVWGIGRQLTERLGAMGIRTAWQLAQADAWTLRKKFSVVLEKRHGNYRALLAWNWTASRHRNRRFAAAECSASVRKTCPHPRSGRHIRGQGVREASRARLCLQESQGQHSHRHVQSGRTQICQRHAV